MEVIAKKSRGLYAAQIILIVFGVFFILVGAGILIVAIGKNGHGGMYAAVAGFMAVGAWLTIYGAVSMRRLRRLPENLIVRDGDTLHIYGVKKGVLNCKAGEISNLSFRTVGGSGMLARDALLFSIGAEKFTLSYLANGAEAYGRLLLLIAESCARKTREEKPETAAEQKTEGAGLDKMLGLLDAHGKKNSANEEEKEENTNG